MTDLPNCKMVKKPNWSKSRPFADDLVVKSLDDCSTAESFTEFGKMGEKLEMEFSIA